MHGRGGPSGPPPARTFPRPHPDLASPLEQPIFDELRWHFEQRAASINGAAVADEERFTHARSAFSPPRFRALYRHWLTDRKVALEVVSSRAIADAIELSAGRVECYVLPHQYRHLSLGPRRFSYVEGGRGGEETGSQPRPPHSLSWCASRCARRSPSEPRGSTCEAFAL